MKKLAVQAFAKAGAGLLLCGLLLFGPAGEVPHLSEKHRNALRVKGELMREMEHTEFTPTPRPWDGLVLRVPDDVRACMEESLITDDDVRECIHAALESGDARGGEPLYVVTCFSDRDKLLDLPCVKKEAL